MDFQQLASSVAEALKNNKTKESIYMEFLQQGETVDAIERAFSQSKDVVEVSPEDTQKKTITIVVIIAALLIGAGVFSFIASNWTGMSNTLKVSVILVAMFISYTLGWIFHEQKGYKKIGEAFYLLGALIYGGGIFLVAQIFNIRANWPDGFLLWMIGTLALGFSLKSYMPYFLALVLGIVAVSSHPFLLFTSFFTHFDPFLLTSTLLLIVSTIVTFITARAMAKKIEDKEFY